jgi:hypothetical protein
MKISNKAKEVPTVKEILSEVKEQAKEEVVEEVKKDKLHDMFYHKSWKEKMLGIIRIWTA